MIAKRICLSLVVAGILSITAEAVNPPSGMAGAAGVGDVSVTGAKGNAETQDPQGSGILDVLKRADNALEGSWTVTVNLESPPPGFAPSFTALETYSRGGGLVTSNNLPPVPRPGHGAWKRIGTRFKVAIQFFLFDQNGAPAGGVNVQHDIRLRGYDEYDGVGTARFFDLNGNLLAEVAFNTRGQRIKP